MSLFCWYLDHEFVKNSQLASSFNEFSFYYFVGESQSAGSRPRSPIYIREESTSNHFNVYHDGERLDIVPVGSLKGWLWNREKKMFSSALSSSYILLNHLKT